MSELTDAQIVRIIVHGAMANGIAPEQASALARELFALRAENADLRARLAAISGLAMSLENDFPFTEEGEDDPS